MCSIGFAQCSRTREVLSSFLDLGGVKNKNQGCSSLIPQTIPGRVRRQGQCCHAAAPLPLPSDLLIENNSELTALISCHCCGAAAPAMLGPYQRHGCHVALAEGRSVLGQAFAFPPSQGPAAVAPRALEIAKH